MQETIAIIETKADLSNGIAWLAARDRRLMRVADALSKAGVDIPLRRVAPGFEALLRLIVYQQVSLQSAAAIWQRTQAAGLTAPKAVLAGGADALLAVGFSRQKARYGLGIAEAVIEGRLDLMSLEQLSDKAARAKLMALPGIGAWTADLYLLSALGRTDSWPAADLALKVAAQNALGLPGRPETAQMEALAENWRPYRAIAARLMWAYYTMAKPPKTP